MAKKSRGSRTSVQRPTQSGEGPEYRSWLTLVPAEKRELISGLLRKHKVNSYDDLISFSQVLLAELVEGNITPAIAREARMYAELMFTIIATKNTAQGTPESAYSDVITALVSVRRESPRLEASYTVVDAIPAEDDLPEKIVINDKIAVNDE